MTVSNESPDDPRNDDAPAVTAVAGGSLELGLADIANLRWAAVDVSAPLEEARRRLDLSPIAAVALGRAMAAAALLLRFTTKNLGRVIVEVAGDGPLGRIVAEVDSAGRMRGLVGDPHVETPTSGELEIGWAVGSGVFRVIRDSPRGRYTSQVALENGEIGTDLAHFLEQSEQIRSAALVGVLPRPDGIAAAGGLVVEALPGTEAMVLGRLEANIAELPGVSTALADGGVEALRTAVMGSFSSEVTERLDLAYDCPCERGQLLERLGTLSDDDVDDLVDADGSFELECAYCADRFTVHRDELRSISTDDESMNVN
ncbi:MAG: Hsp33 family molecular chaperone HslO [Acidobacteriota bacterium]